MAERATWAVDDRIGSLDARIAAGALLFPGTTNAMGHRGGILPGPVSAFAVLATSPTPNGLVHVNPGHIVIPGTRSTAPYVAALDAVKDINVLSTPADGTNARRDLIVAQQNDTLHADGNSDFTIRHVVGTPAASPSDPSVSGSPDYVVLARVAVAANATSIGQGVITDLRPGLTVAVGGILPVTGQTERDAISNPFEGMMIHRKDRRWNEYWDGTAWRVADTAIASGSADLTAAVTHPRIGQIAWRTDTHQLYRWNGTVWRRVMPSESHQYASNFPTSAMEYSTTPSSVASVTVSDPGYPYIVEASAVFECGATSGRWDAVFRLGSASGTSFGHLGIPVVRNESGGGGWMNVPAGRSDTLTGTQTVHLAYYRAVGGGNGQVSEFNSSMLVRVIPQPQA